MAAAQLARHGSPAASAGVSPMTLPSIRSQKTFEDDPCTDRCRSKEHGRRIWEIAHGADDASVVALWMKTCMNYNQVKDDLGRTALHAAASTGKVKAVEWLVKTTQVNINAKDFVSGYTPLHASIYFGHLHVARSLLKLGADVNIRDNEGLTPFELCQIERPQSFCQYPGDLKELVVWGTNANYNLGLGHQHPRQTPDVLEVFRKQPKMALVKVDMSTYHTMFVTQTGEVYASGYGLGGRLGTGNETTALSPTQVSLRHVCTDVAVGQDHTVFIANSKVWSVGSNEFGQLGFGSNCPRLLTPRSIDSIRKNQITGILATTVHSVFYSASIIYMCGSNLGQFGKHTSADGSGSSLVFSPTLVSDALPLNSLGNGAITSVAGNEYCSAVCVDQKYILLLRRYQHARIDTRHTTSQEIKKIQACGDQQVTTLFLLTESGRVLVWRESRNKTTGQIKGEFTRLVFSCNRLLDVQDFSVNLSSLVVITKTGGAYKAGWNYNNPPTIVGRIDERYSQIPATDFQIALRTRRGARNLAETPPMALEQMKIKALNNVHTGLHVSSDPKGNNFAILQRHQMMDLRTLPNIGESRMDQDLKDLYESTSEDDCLQDVVFSVGIERFPAHRIVLASASAAFRKVLQEQSTPETKETHVSISNAMFDLDFSKCASLEEGRIFKSVLDILYTGTCFLCTTAYWQEIWAYIAGDEEPNGLRFMEKTKEIVRLRNMYRALGIEAGVTITQTLLNNLDSIDQASQDHAWFDRLEKRLVLKRTFNREECVRFCDIRLESQDNVLFNAHKCILSARLDFFKSRFSMNWNEDSQTIETVKLPMSSKAMSVLLEFVYTDGWRASEHADMDLLCEVIACADFFCLQRLTTIAESNMTRNISIKTVEDVLKFADAHNCFQLRDTCFAFISLNLPAILESRMLDSLPTDIFEMLGAHYRNAQDTFSFQPRQSICRDIPTSEEYEDAVSGTSPEILEQLLVIENVDVDDGRLLKKNQPKSTRTRVRLRSRTLSEGEHDSTFGSSCSVEDIVTTSTPVGSPVLPSATPLSPLLPERTYIVPIPRNALKSLNDVRTSSSSPVTNDEEFPSLGNANVRSTPPSLPSSGSDNLSSRTVPKLVPAKCDVLSEVVVSTPSKGQATSCISITEEKPKLLEKKSDCISPVAAGGGGGKKKIKWRKVTSESDIVVPKPASPSSANHQQLTIDGRDRNNPWKMKTKREATLQDIMEDEMEKKKNFEKATSKSLSLMQIEDEAINDLTLQFSSVETRDFIEVLSVERVGTSNYSTPTWVQHPGVATSLNPDPSL